MAGHEDYSSKAEAGRILDYLCGLLDPVSLPPEVAARRGRVEFTAERDEPYFPVPFKETETTAALKAIEGSVAALLAETGRDGDAGGGAAVRVDLERTTAFLFQAYWARVGGRGKLDKDVGEFLKDTDLLRAQSDPYRRMSANLYRTKEPGEYYHIHGSLEASTTLNMIGLESHRPDLQTHEQIVQVIEGAVEKFTVDELEALNNRHRQAGIKAFTHADFVKTPHGKTSLAQPPWSVESLEATTPPTPLPRTRGVRVLSGVRVLELCRIIAGPVIARILGEYGAEVLKVTSPHLSDVPFFQVDGNMGKRAADVDLKTAGGRAVFEALLGDVDVVVDGYRPGALDRLGYGPRRLAELAARRGRGVVYVNENCFGFEGEWAHRAGWQQIADCVTGVAWEQGRFMGLDEPVVPPFPMSDYGTGCMGAVAALVGLYHRAARGGSWHGKTSLVQYDLLLFRVGALPAAARARLRAGLGAELLALRHGHSVDQVSGAALRHMRRAFPGFVDDARYLDRWHAAAYGRDVAAVRPVVEVEGLDVGFARASRPNGSDPPTWDFGAEEDYRL